MSMSQRRPVVACRLHQLGVAGRRASTCTRSSTAASPQNAAASVRRRGCSKQAQGCDGEALGHPGDVGGVGHAEEERRLGRRVEDALDAVDHLGRPPGSARMIGPATSTSDWPFDRVGGVEVHELPDPVSGPVGDAGDDHAAVAVADQDHVAQVLVEEERHDVA